MPKLDRIKDHEQSENDPYIFERGIRDLKSEGEMIANNLDSSKAANEQAEEITKIANALGKTLNLINYSFYEVPFIKEEGMEEIRSTLQEIIDCPNFTLIRESIWYLLALKDQIEIAFGTKKIG